MKGIKGGHVIEKQYIQRIEAKLKKGIIKELKNHHPELALELISTCGNLLYNTNLYYIDNELESALKEVSFQIKLPLTSEKKDNVALLYDGFGLDNRGLAQIYVEALSKIKNLVYVTYSEFKNNIPTIREIIEKNGGKVRFIDGKRMTFTEKIRVLNEIVLEEKPKDFLFYSYPNDVVATTLMNAYEGKISRYQINLTDHAFWLGARCIDKCIEFRDYGAWISKKYREISEEKIVKLPFYPKLHKERKFQGFPFEVKENQKVVFSGGSLYKTLGDGNKYYQMVEHILECYEDVIFWYAGSGDDSEIKKIMKKYPERAYYSLERQDLYQVIKNSRLYLSTYPIPGGLMYQFAASAGRVPVTLHYDECNEGFLLEQKKLQVEFKRLDSLYDEVEKILYDDDYFKRREKQMLASVMTEDKFLEGMRSILNSKNPNKICYEEIDTEKFRELYLTRVKQSDIDGGLACKNSMIACLRYIPCEVLRGGITKVKKKLRL